jgi:hypothetical protein
MRRDAATPLARTDTFLGHAAYLSHHITITAAVAASAYASRFAVCTAAIF